MQFDVVSLPLKLYSAIFLVDTIFLETSQQQEDSYLFRKDVYRRSQFQLQLNSAETLLPGAKYFLQIFYLKLLVAS